MRLARKINLGSYCLVKCIVIWKLLFILFYIPIIIKICWIEILANESKLFSEAPLIKEKDQKVKFCVTVRQLGEMFGIQFLISYQGKGRGCCMHA